MWAVGLRIRENDGYAKHLPFGNSHKCHVAVQRSIRQTGLYRRYDNYASVLTDVLLSPVFQMMCPAALHRRAARSYQMDDMVIGLFYLVFFVFSCSMVSSEVYRCLT